MSFACRIFRASSLRRFSLPVAVIFAAAVFAVPFAAIAANTPDYSTPQSAAKAFGHALEQGDAVAAKAASNANDQQAKLIDSIAALISSMKKMGDAAVSKFGPVDGKALADQNQRDLAKEVDDADVKVTGDTATLTPKKKPADEGEPQPMVLKKGADNQWKVDVGSVFKTEEIDRAISIYNASSKAADETTAEILAGKYKTANDAKQAIGVKMMGIMMGTSAPTQPATPPAENK